MVRDAMEDFEGEFERSYVDPIGLTAYTACCLIPLDTEEPWCSPRWSW